MRCAQTPRRWTWGEVSASRAAVVRAVIAPNAVIGHRKHFEPFDEASRTLEEIARAAGSADAMPGMPGNSVTAALQDPNRKSYALQRLVLHFSRQF